LIPMKWGGGIFRKVGQNSTFCSMLFLIIVTSRGQHAGTSKAGSVPYLPKAVHSSPWFFICTWDKVCSTLSTVPSTL
jgi:hypothetical protein